MDDLIENVDQKLLHAMILQFEKYSAIQRVLLFGSRARGDHTERSDYDIAVCGDLRGQDRAKLRNTLEQELPTLHKIDLVFMDELKNEALLRNIENEGRIIYCGKSDK